MATTTDDVRIELVNSEDDMPGFWECMYQALGVQTNDAFMAALHPNMHTPEGYASDVASNTKQWLENGKDSTTRFWLKATVPSDSTGTHDGRRIVGVTIWYESLQSRNPPSNDIPPSELEAKYPGDERQQRFVKQIFASLYGGRKEVVKEAGLEGRPVLILDLCAVHPDFQGRGISRRLVQWGLDYASRKGEEYGGGTLECFTEASVMGRPVYLRMGFQEQGEVVYDVDDEFKDRRTAPNMLLRRPRGLPV